MRTIVCINVLRSFTFITGAITLTSHAAQCALYSAYQHQTSIPDWFKAGHWQYLLWYISLSVSVLSSAAICVHAGCCRRAHILRGDKTLSIANVFTLSITILLITFLGGQEPWTDGLVEFKQPAKGFMPYCGMLDANNDALYPILYHRCLLIDATYIGACLNCLLWLLLLPFSIFCKTVKRASSVGKLPAEESKWGKYMPQPPSHQRHNSILTRGSSLNNNNYSSTTPLTQHQPLPEPTLPNMYEHIATDYYGRNYEYTTTTPTGTTMPPTSSTAYTLTTPMTPASSYYYDDGYRDPPTTAMTTTSSMPLQHQNNHNHQQTYQHPESYYYYPQQHYR